MWTLSDTVTHRIRGWYVHVNGVGIHRFYRWLVVKGSLSSYQCIALVLKGETGYKLCRSQESCLDHVSLVCIVFVDVSRYIYIYAYYVCWRVDIVDSRLEQLPWFPFHLEPVKFKPTKIGIEIQQFHKINYRTPRQYPKICFKPEENWWIWRNRHLRDIQNSHIPSCT